MSLIQLNLESLLEVRGGVVARMLEKALNRIASDCEAAPDIAEWREVRLLIKAKPRCEVIGQQVELTDVETRIEVPGVKVPSRSAGIVCKVRSTTNGARQLFFELDAPDSPDQLTLLETEKAS